ncbi:MAG: hypothetical protein JNL98_01270 [Bryobacterales bacterium]|nr:hypothetical protein [Bryobacterales bacterium]
MNRRPNRLLLIQTLAASALLGALQSCAPSTSAFVVESPQFDPAFPMQPQVQSVRTYRELRLRRVASVPVPNSSLHRIRTDAARRTVFMLDKGSGCVLRFQNERWEQWDSLCLDGSNPAAKLRAPISEFDMDEGGNLILAAARKLHKISPSGEVSAFPDATAPAASGPFAVNQGRAVFMPFPATDELSSFRSLSLDRLPALSVLPRFLQRNKDHLFAVAGKFAPDHSRQAVYYSADRSGFLAALSVKSDAISLAFARGTIDHTPLSRLERPTPNVLRFPFGQPIASLDLCVDAGRLWVLAKAPLGAKTFQFVLDAYDPASGDYQFSYELPVRPRGLGWYRGRLLMIVGDSLEVWDAKAA